MSILPVLQEPDARLRQISQSVSTVDDRVRTQIRDMQDTLQDQQGLALAAPQVGILKRMVVYDQQLLFPDKDIDPAERFLCMINPIIERKSEDTYDLEEGCLSVPELRVNVARAQTIQVTFLTPDGHEKTIQATDLFAVCIQHEIDHLDGVLMIDYLSPLKKNITQRKLLKIKRRQQEDS